MRWSRCLFIVILLYGGQAWGDCKSDCQNDYQSEINSCREQFSEPDDGDDLAECTDDAKKGYEFCLEECETEADVRSETIQLDKRSRLTTKGLLKEFPQ